jgi:hypothetical protein
MSSRLVLVDETKARRYRLAAVAVDGPDVASSRAALRALLRPGRRSLHFRKESDRRRRAILTCLGSLDWRGTVVASEWGVARLARADCLRMVIDYAVAVGAQSVVLERDGAALAADRKVFYSYLQRHVSAGQMAYRHAARHEASLLWIPDAVAWCVARGGDWRRRVEDRVVVR